MDNCYSLNSGHTQGCEQYFYKKEEIYAQKEETFIYIYSIHKFVNYENTGSNLTLSFENFLQEVEIS